MKDLYNQMFTSKSFRKMYTSRNHLAFFATYFKHYVTCKTAPFQNEIFQITQNPSITHAVIVAFRGSGKSTIVSTSLPIWAVLGKLQKKFVVIISQTQKQSELILNGIRNELENNVYLKNDYNLKLEYKQEWNTSTLVIPDINARILATSTNESNRGIRHQQYRPDLIICDDIESLDSVKTKEGRDKTAQWFFGEIMPLGDENTKIVVIGNLLHEDSLIMRLKEKQESLAKDGHFVFKEYPLLDPEGNIAWLGKYENMDAINRKKNEMEHIAWNREMLLKILPTTDAVIQLDWIKYYDKFPDPSSSEYDLRFYISSVDLAVSKSDSADYTAIISAAIYQKADDLYIYILSPMVNKRMDFPETIEKIVEINNHFFSNWTTHKVIVENVAYQAAAVQTLKLKCINVEGIPIAGSDKRTRLAGTSNYVKYGQVMFPREGAEELVSQLVGFGIEKHDDLSDAFSLLVLNIMAEAQKHVHIPFTIENHIFDNLGPSYSYANPYKGRRIMTVGEGPNAVEAIY